MILMDKQDRNSSQRFALSRMKDGFLYNFMTDSKPVVYVMLFNHTSKTGSSSTALGPGYMVNWYCAVKTEIRIARGDRRGTYYPGSPFTCEEANPNCWHQLQKVLEGTCGNGRYVNWASDRNSGLRSHNVEGFVLYHWTHRPAWRQSIYPEFTILQALIPAVNSSEGYGKRFRDYSEKEPFAFEVTIEPNGFRQPEDLIFITTEKVVAQESAFEMYIENFDASTWMYLAGATVLTAAVVASFFVGRSIGEDFTVSTRAVRAGNTFTFILSLFIDQAPRTYPFEPRTAFAAKFLRVLVATWLLGVLFLSNFYKAEVQSSFGFLFPFRTELKTWDQFENFSLFSFIPSSCRCEPGKYHVEDWQRINVEYFEWEIGNQQGPLPRSRSNWKSPVRHTTFQNLLRDRKFLAFPVLFSLRNMEITSDFCLPTNTSLEQCKRNTEIVDRMRQRLDFICASEFSNFSGEAYLAHLDRFKHLHNTSIWKWNLTFELTNTHYFSTYVPNFRSWEVIYWATRKRQTAFVLTESLIPFYWNLFKQVMNSSTIRFAHTGPHDITKDVEKRRRGHNYRGSSLTLKGPLIRMPEIANWMLQRMRAMTSAGLLGWYEKWDRILYPPRKYELGEIEVQESTTGFKPMSLKDEALQIVFLAVGFGLFLGFLAWFVELCR